MQKFILFVLISGTIKFLCYCKNHYLYWKVGGEITLWSLERKLSLWLASWFQKRHLSENSFCDNDIFDSIFLKDYYSSYVLDVALCLTLHLVTNPVSGALQHFENTARLSCFIAYIRSKKVSVCCALTFQLRVSLINSNFTLSLHASAAVNRGNGNSHLVKLKTC